MDDNLIQKIQQRSENQKILEIKNENKKFIIEFLKTPILIVGFDEDGYIDELVVKNVPGLNESVSYLLLDLLEELPSMQSEEFERLPRKIRGINFSINFAGILFSNNSLTNQNILLSKTNNTSSLLLNSMKETVVMNLTPNGMVYSILTEDNYQNSNFIMTLELIKDMLNKGLEMKVLNQSFKEFINNITLLQEKLYSDSKMKILKNLAVTTTKIAIGFTIIFLLLNYLGIHIPVYHLET